MIYGDIFYLVMNMLLGAFCFWLAGYAQKALNTKWKLVYALPLLVCIFAIAFTGWESCLVGAYIGSLLLLAGFFKEEKKLRSIASVLAVVLSISAIPVCHVSAAYRAPDYLADFEEGFAAMKKYYHLAEYKGIDWDDMYARYRPQFVKVQKEHDGPGNFILWLKFTDEFHDAHTYYYAATANGADGDLMDAASDRMYGNDYGLSLLRMEDGGIAAIDVDKDGAAHQAGIRNGTRILAWDGQDIDAMIEAFDQPMQMGNPVRENEDFLKPVYAAGTGGDEVTVTFETESGETAQAILPKTGTYTKRLEREIEILMEGVKESNVDVRTLNEDTALMRLSGMTYDQKSSQNSDYTRLYEEAKQKLGEQKDKGVKNLIIDCRANNGGDPDFNLQFFKLLKPEGEYIDFYSGVWDTEKNQFAYDEENGHYVVGNGPTYKGENFWGDGKIVVLVSAYTISAGDFFTLVMSKCPNVTVMGYTHSNCSGQGVRGVSFSRGQLSFSHVPSLHEDGSFLIDTDQTRTATTPLDERILIDEEMIHSVFDEGEDYILDKAIAFCGE